MHSHTHGIETDGPVIRWPSAYDLLLKIVTLGPRGGSGAASSQRGRLAPGRRVLDVGCGTGTLALLAAEAVGPSGQVHGVDPAPEMVGAARAKAARKGAQATFEVGAIESLGLPDRSVDVAFSTLMFHHLTPKLQGTGMQEIRRVLAPGGCLVLADFGKAEPVVELAKAAGFVSVRLLPMRPRLVFLMVAESGVAL